MKKIIAPVRGMRDILPDELPAWERLEAAVATVMRAYGYQQLRTPILEREELFARPVGEATDIVHKELFRCTAANGSVYCMRPEGTVATVRALAQADLIGKAKRIWYMGPMFRHERPQKGRLRQFHQFGAEYLGSGDPLADVELIQLCWRLWQELGIAGQVQLQLNNLGTADERQAYVARLGEYLHAHVGQLGEDDRRRLDENPLRVLDSKEDGIAPLIDAAPALRESLGAESRAHYDKVRNELARAGIKHVENPRLVRGLDYYNLTVYEWADRSAADRRQGSIAGGGRYDGLLEKIGGAACPGTGMAAGMERILALLGEASGDRALADIFLATSKNALGLAGLLHLAEAMRDQELSVVVHLREDKIPALFKHAGASGARYAVIIGAKEASKQAAIVKPLREDTPQFELNQAELPSMMSGLIAR